MKELEKTDLPEVGGGAWSDEGCTNPWPDPFSGSGPTGTPADPTQPQQLNQ